MREEGRKEWKEERGEDRRGEEERRGVSKYKIMSVCSCVGSIGLNVSACGLSIQQHRGLSTMDMQTPNVCIRASWTRICVST